MSDRSSITINWGDITKSSKIYSNKELSTIENKLSCFTWKYSIIHPFEDEGLVSWFIRQSWQFNITARNLIKSELEFWLKNRSIGLGFDRIDNLILNKLDVIPLSNNFSKALVNRGIRFELSKHQIDLSNWIDVSNPNNHNKRALNDYFEFNLKYCSKCWHEERERYFRMDWRFPFVQVCLYHGVMLKSSCDSCGKDLFSNISNLDKTALYKCQHCETDIAYSEIENNEDLMTIQNILYENIISNKFDINERNKIFGLMYNEIIDELIDLLRARINISSMWGIEIAKYDLLKFFENNKKKPNSRDHGMDNIRYGTKTKEWKKLGLNSWNNLLELVFGEINMKQGIFTGKNGMNLAITQMTNFFEENNKYPNSRDMSSIATFCQAGYWSEFDINSWNDLLLLVFDDVNIILGKFVGKEGFDNAIDQLNNYYKSTGKIPTSTNEDFQGIVSAIKRGLYLEYNISTWNDILQMLFQNVNKKNKKYVGREGLKLATFEINNFYEKNHQIPTSRDEGMRSIVYAAQSGKYWISYDILSWNELLISIFGMEKLRKRIKIKSS